MSCWRERVRRRLSLNVPIAPGMMRQIDIATWQRFLPGEIAQPKIEAGSVALDGEREVSFSERDKVTIRIEEHAFYTVDVSACMRYAAMQRTDAQRRIATARSLDCLMGEQEAWPRIHFR